MADYLEWVKSIQNIPFSTWGQPLKSHNKIEVVCLSGYEKLLKKAISPGVVYVPRIKILGEIVYSLLDYHLNPGERVTPNVCPISQNQLWRQYIDGIPGEDWRGDLYKSKGSLEAADLALVGKILHNHFAQRIALLDFITLCQDRSARNWVVNGLRFWAVDNGIFWPYNGRFADKRVIKTGKTNHLNPPMQALMSQDPAFAFKIGIFSSLYAGNQINDGLLAYLFYIDWRQFFDDLAHMVQMLGYPVSLVDDWRFGQVRRRAEYLLRRRRFPTVSETGQEEWQRLIDKPRGGNEVWSRQWEIKNLETA